MTTKKTLHIYCRANSNVINQQQVIRAQELVGMQKANQLGYDYKVYVEEDGLSKRDSIPVVLNQLLEHCKSGKVSDVFVLDLDRLSRSVTVLEKLKEKFKLFQVNLHTQLNRVDFNPTAKGFIAEIKELMANRDRACRAVRSSRSRETLK